MDGQVIDLTHTIEEHMPTYPGHPIPTTKLVKTIEKDGYNLHLLCLSTHVGTHLDSPYHVNENGCRTNHIPLERLVGDAVFLDMSSKKPNEFIGVTDLKEKDHLIRSNDIVLLYTGFCKMWGQRTYISSHPYLSENAADWLRNKKIKVLAIDTVSVDSASSEDLPVHKILLASDIAIIENLANLDSIRQPRLSVIALPLKIKGVDGAPIRVIAFKQYG